MNSISLSPSSGLPVRPYMHPKLTALFFAQLLPTIALGSMSVSPAAAKPANCAESASAACYFSFEPAGVKGRLHYYASQSPVTGTPGPAPVRALIAVHGHSRDANRTFNAALLAVKRANVINKTLVVAPVFQVAASIASKCQTVGVPKAQEGDLLWTCGTWLKGGAASNDGDFTSFAALDALITELGRRWPSLHSITIVGFSAGAQMVQHYIAFAAAQDAGDVAIRYVVADPGTWLYFNDLRPQPVLDGQAVDWSKCSGGADFLGNCKLEFTKMKAQCPRFNRWKYGTAGLPESLRRGAAQARARYAEADIRYLEGALDSGAAFGAAYKILDKSCAASAQGPYRLQRGIAYAQYDRTVLAPGKQRKVVVVPGCAHDAACVFASDAARAALFGP
jgi:pimeloyl-ACP methyl ester carboxylesterase